MKRLQHLSATALLIAFTLFLYGTSSALSVQEEEGIDPDVREACSQCHLAPTPDLLPRSEWREKVNTMFHLANLELLAKYGRPIWELDPPRVANEFIERAPADLEARPWGPAEVSSRVSFNRTRISGGSTIVERPGGANVQLFDLFEDNPGPELIICDMLSGWVTWLDPDHPEEGLQPIAQLKSPCHSELVDLDQDGRLDLLVAELGDPLPSDAEFGSVALLRRTGPRDFETVRLTPDIGRVADARPGDFDGDGDLDLVVAEFGWRKLGSVLYLENVSTGGNLEFEMTTVDPRHGAIHVPVVDLNGDGHLDFLALISQEHETVVAFLNKGNGEFDVEEVFRGPHPHWGASGMEPVDFDSDGDLDILITNGDTLDDMKLREYHGIAWLENGGSFPFTEHRIDTYYGVHRAEAGDLDGDGDLDIVASSFLPDLEDDRLNELNLSGLVWYEQLENGSFQPHPVVEGIRCDFPTLELGDFDGDGLLDIMVANLMGTPRRDGSEAALVEVFRQVKE